MDTNTNTSRRALIGALAIAPVVIAAPAAAMSENASANLDALFARYRAVYAHYDMVCETVSGPARERRRAAQEAARQSVPHVEMTVDLSWCYPDNPTKTLSSADRIDVAGAASVAAMKFEPADDWSPDQHRLFDKQRAFHKACMDRDAQVARAVADAGKRFDTTDANAQEDAAWNIVSRCGSAIIDFQPRTVADLAAKLAFYEETSLLPAEELMEHVRRDVSLLAESSANNLVLREG